MIPGSHRGPRTRALLLVGHGSHLNASSSTPVYEHARRLRATGGFDEVVEVFWKEEPLLRDAIALTDCDDVHIVPLFLAEGYFTRQVLPRELGLSDPRAVGDDRRIHYHPPVGAHPAMEGLVLDQALAVSLNGGFAAAAATVVIIGHGTERNDTSGDTVHQLVASLRERGEFASVACGFLDESPGIAEVLDSVNTEEVILIPYFLAEGWHTAATIPRDLSLEGARTVRGGRTIWYAPPVGTLHQIAGIVLSMVDEATAEGGVLADPVSADPPSGAGARFGATRKDRPVTVARRHFFEWVDQAGMDGATFLRVRIGRAADGLYRVTHESDWDATGDRVVRSSDPESALEFARADDAGQYRPLRFADTLATGWRIEGLDADGLWRAISLLYPGAVLHWAEHRFGAPGAAVVPFATWAARQSGMYERIGSIGQSALLATIAECCGSCLRGRRWSTGLDASMLEAMPAEASRSGVSESGMEIVPCLEPCAVFGSRALHRARFAAVREASDPRPAPQSV